MQNIAPSEQLIIKDYLQAGRENRAISYYRQLTGCSQIDAASRIDKFIKNERLVNPHAYKDINNATTKPKTNLFKILIFFIALLIIANAVKWDKLIISDSINAIIQEQYFFQQIKRTLGKYFSLDKHSEITISPKKSPKLPEAENMTDMHKLYQKKLANTDYQSWKSSARKSTKLQAFPEEFLIKKLRSQYAARQILPKNEKAITIPLIKESKPHIDGIIKPSEWKQGLILKTKKLADSSSVYMQADNKWLYLAADVPKDTTAKGFDQFRFYFHINLIPEIINERIHVRGGKHNNIQRIGGYRQTNVRWNGKPAINKSERWKKYNISDPYIYQNAKGASSIHTHRQYEVKILLTEAGIHPGSVFAAYAIIETDPLRKENGKFKKRQYLGKLASRKKPQWFIIPKQIEQD